MLACFYPFPGLEASGLSDTSELLRAKPDIALLRELACVLAVRGGFAVTNGTDRSRGPRDKSCVIKKLSLQQSKSIPIVNFST